MAKCLFSIIVPLYNKETTIKRTIDSVLKQTCQDFEIVVVDDGSKDNGASIAQEIDDNRITVIRQPNGGVSAARNKGIEHAKGQFITFIDADDEYAPEHLETLKHLIENYPDYNVYATSHLIVSGSTKSMPYIKNLNFKTSKKSNEGVLESYFHTVASRHNPLHIGSISVRRAAIGEIRFPVGVKAGEDLYFIARLMVENEIVFSLDYTYIYNFEETNRVMNIHEKVDDCFDSLLQSGCKDKYLRHYVALWHTRRAVYAMRTKNTKIIAYHLWRSLQIRPFQTKIFTAMLSALIRH
ncbi:MAG: glycosyltransferase [Prevotella sp.]|nr:glycosyltransferase [Prevotella sp.]